MTHSRRLSEIEPNSELCETRLNLIWRRVAQRFEKQRSKLLYHPLGLRFVGCSLGLCQQYHTRWILRSDV